MPEQQRLWRDAVEDQFGEVAPRLGDRRAGRKCPPASVSREGFHRYLNERMPVEEDTELRTTIQEMALPHRRRYGYKPIRAGLRERGMLVNPERAKRILRTTCWRSSRGHWGVTIV
jgi:hypothetical protein